ncbi:MAG: ferrous iron transport protein B [Negativicutes bacterium]|nr:ferrous iron transport protein B [Negativicutes bacterium]
MGTASLTIALAGNPNSGKTTIFNNITGARQHVGNYPGVTVERREGVCRYQGKNLLLVDLPGTYSLTAYSLDEIVARNFIVEEKPDIIVNVLDAANLERNLYLAVQLLELERPVALALNMTDTAEKVGIRINDKVLSQKLGVPVVRTVGNRNKGTKELLQAAVAASSVQYRSFRIDYGADVEAKIQILYQELETVPDNKYPKRWLAVKLLENDKVVNEKVAALVGGQRVLTLAEQCRSELAAGSGDDAETIIADRRYRYVADVFNAAVSKSMNVENFSDKIDKVLTNRVLGLPIFFSLMWLLFNLVFTVGAYPQGWIEDGISWLGDWIGAYMADGELKSLIVDGIIGGVGGVVVFLPNIVLLFLGIAILEDSGYMARAAFVMDRAMRFAGLHGKSFIPMLMGFGCGVPAIMGTRTLENPRDRMVTILVAPLMSCSARLPVYTLLIAAFFAEEVAGTVLFSVYLLGILLAVLMALIFRNTLFKGDSEPFVMELPPYHLPTLRSVLMHMWERSVIYLKKMGSIILAASILIWFLTNYPAEVEYSKNYEELRTQAEAAFTENVAKDVYAPLGAKILAENLEDLPELKAIAAEIAAINTEFDEKTADLAEGSAELAALEADKENRLKKLEADNEKLYPLAARYVELQGEFEGAQKKLDYEQAAEKLEKSYAGRIGHGIAILTQPLGFDWKIGIALMTGLAAKEVVVSTLGTIYSIGEADETSTALKEALAADPTLDPLVALTLMAFTLIYAPCLAAMAAVKRETNSWKWAAFTMVYSTGLAWVVSFVIYQGGRALGY